MITDMLIHAGLGSVLGAQFAAAALSKRRLSDKTNTGKSEKPLSLYIQNILLVGMAFVSLVIIMKYVRDFQPRHWANLISLFVAAGTVGFGSWNLLFRPKTDMENGRKQSGTDPE